jgi:hypothetical protein
MPEEHEGEVSFMYEWKEIVRSSAKLSKSSSSIYSRDMLLACWWPILLSISYGTFFRDCTIYKSLKHLTMRKTR